MDNHLMVYIHYKYTFKILILKCLVITHLHGLLLLLSSMKFSKNIFVSTNVLTVRKIYIIISVELLQQVCFGIPSKLNNVSSIKRPDVNDLGFGFCISRNRISIERR